MIFFIKTLLIVLTFLIFSLNTKAQKIYGKVIDANTKTGIPFASVSDENTNKGVITNIQGSFEFKIPDNNTLIISCIGYKTEKIVCGNDTIIVELLKLDYMLQEISVFARSDNLEKISTAYLKNKQIKEFAGISKDAMRSVQLFPGISVNNELSANYNVRGGSYDENSVLINGVRVYEPFHLKEEPLVSVGIFNIDLVDKIDFSSGGFSAKYGDALSSLLKIDYKEGNREKISGNLDLSLIDLGMIVEGPISSNFAYQFGIRKDYSKYMLKMSGGNNESVKLSYYDIHSQLNYIFSPAHRLKFNFIYSFDDFYLDPPRTSTSNYTENIQFNYPSQPSEIITSFTHSDYKQEANMSYSNTLFSVNSFNRISHWLNNNTVVSYYSEKSDEKNSVTYERIRDYQHTIKYYDIYTINDLKNNNLTINTFSVRSDFTFKLTNYNSLLVGVFNDNISYNTDSKDNRNKIWANDIANYPDTVYLPYQQINDTINIKFDSYKVGGYIEDNLQINKNLIIRVGGRIDYFEKNRNLSISPRVSMAYLLPFNLRLKSAWGVYYQTPTYKQLKNSISSKDNTKNQKVVHYIFGIEYSKPNVIDIKLDGYYKDYLLLIAAKRLFSNEIIYSQETYSKGYAKGFDISVSKIHKWYSLWLSYGFLISKEKSEKEIKYYNRFTNQKHTFSSSFSLFFNNNWETSIKLFYGSGYSYTPFEITYDFEISLNVWTELGKNSAHYPAYSRVDYRISKEFSLFKNPLLVYIDILNLFNKKNVVSYSYSYNSKGKPIRRANELLPIIPSIGLSYSF
ncbi:MAG: TonB-dependent receptor [Bacteroidales bacterium]|nr:TonB-dependent receptor [Bacteroidales bacterium]